MADLVVEPADRGPRCVVRSTFAVLAFDDEGGIDTARFDGQQLALAESALAPVFAVPERDTPWSTPPSDLSRTEARGLRRAAWLEHRRCGIGASAVPPPVGMTRVTPSALDSEAQRPAT